jgi:NAD(P)H-nitrite reductase large subunit
MAATRFVEGLVAGGYAGHVTVLGDEPVPAYNRILLSAVLEGTHAPDALTLRSPGWYAEHGIDLRTGTRVLAVDREHGDVMLVDGTLVPFDRLVLATGSIPTGLLGVQVARALSLRGVATEVVEGGEHVLHRQVSTPAGKILARSLTRLGTTVYTGARAVRLHEQGDSVGLQLDTGFVLDADLVVLTAGGRPSTALARGAGLEVRRGIVVDDHLASPTDPRIHALGDCAEHRGVTTGFVPPAWEQAQLLAARLCGADVVHEGSRSVARLRATDLDVAVLGDPVGEEGEVVEVSNPVAGKHSRLVVRDGVIVAAALVGDLSRVGLITQHYDRGTVLGVREPGDLLLPDPVDAPTVLPDEAEVCACAGVSAGEIRACGSLEELRETTRATTGCGGCEQTCRDLLGATPRLEGVR